MVNFRAKNIEHRRRNGKHEEVVRKKWINSNVNLNQPYCISSRFKETVE